MTTLVVTMIIEVGVGVGLASGLVVYAQRHWKESGAAVAADVPDASPAGR